MNGGDLATWVGSSFAAVAAGATLWTLKSQRDQIAEQREFIGEQSATMALERAELHAAAEDRKWAQARQIRMSHRVIPSVDVSDGVLWKVMVENGSDAPAHGLTVRFGTAYLADEVHEATPDGGRGERWVVPLHLLGPGRDAWFTSQRWSETTAHNSRPSLEFTDDNGVRWTLDSYGKLEERPADPAA
ncbi:hypothetical protein [Streptomyces sp. LN245]|uniref:hypothetical protein n=1 Tax=Streptomyces sp. LN245 TaxID=3112975 RepID=UPI003710F437